jgi:hypothetical protein
MSPALTCIGNVNADLIIGPVMPWPQPGTEVLLDHQDLRFGGSAGNSALAAHGFGAEVRLIANRGNDILGLWLADAMPEHSAGWAVSARPTVISVGISHPDGERTFLTPAGHLADFCLKDVLAQLPAAARPGEVALLSGVFVTPALAPDYDGLIATLKHRGFRVALDTGWPDGGWTAATRARALPWVQACDIILFNEVELLGLMQMAAAAVERAGHSLMAMLGADAILVVKTGPAGAQGFTHSDHAVASAPTVAVIDTIGAGDVFNAAFLMALAAGRPLGSAVQEAVQVTSRIIASHPRRYQRISKAAE